MLNSLKRFALLFAATLVTLLMASCISTGSSSAPQPTGVVVSMPQIVVGNPSSHLEQKTLEYLGQDWSIATSLDMTRDDYFEVIAYKPSAIEIVSDFSDPTYVDFVLLASEVAVVQTDQENPEKEPQVLLSITQEGATSGDVSLVEMSNTEAFLVRYMPTSSSQVTVIPVNAEGEQSMQSLGFTWNDETGRYDLVLSSE